MKKLAQQLKQHILTGTSHMIPFIVAGGVLFSIAIMLNENASVPTQGFLHEIAVIGEAGMQLFIPVLGGYIAFSIADRPGLAPGMIGAYLAQEIQAGFIGGILAGFLAGYIVKQLKRIHLPISLKSIGTIFLYPIGGTLLTGIIILCVIGAPLSYFMSQMTKWLSQFSYIGKIPLGMLLGSMTAFDMGGPINKVATLFAQTQVDTLPYLMGGVGVAICTPSIGTGLATLLFPKSYSAEERQAGKGAILMGCVGISEGAIPFALRNPMQVIPSIVAGAAVGNIMAFMFGVLNHAPWGGLIVLPVIEGQLAYLFSIIVGSFTTAFLMHILRGKHMAAVEEDTSFEFEDL